MLQDYFKLAEQPFGVTPDSRFLYLGNQHSEALASLIYSTESNRGFVALIAPPGMGKTSLLYHYLELLRTRSRTAFVFRTDCSAREFIRHVLLDLGIDAPMDDLPAMHEALNRVLTEEMRAKRRFVLVIDEAQNLSDSVLESIRLLSNFETPWRKLMQIVLAGQPQLAEHLAQPSMVQLRQRISQIIRLEPFTPGEVNSYIDSRLRAAGCREPALFSPGARADIARFSEGIPRNINNIAFNALSLACAMNRKTVDREIIGEVMRDLALEVGEERVIGPAENEPKASTRSVVRAPASPTAAVERKAPRFGRWITAFAFSVCVAAVLFAGIRPSVHQPKFAKSLESRLRQIAEKPEKGAVLTAIAAPAEVLPAKAKSDEAAVEPTSNAPLPVEPERPAYRVSAGQTLWGIVREQFGRYDPNAVAQIRRLNPWIADPNHILSSRKILLPTSAEIANKPSPEVLAVGTSAAQSQVP
jgi:type II secretory pathway predicted ATPase ExeA